MLACTHLSDVTSELSENGRYAELLERTCGFDKNVRRVCKLICSKCLFTEADFAIKPNTLNGTAVWK